MVLRFRPSVAAAALLVGGCSLGPDYKPLDLQAPPAWSSSTSAPSVSIDDHPDGPWWAVLNDPVLDALQADALRTSPTLAEAMAKIAEARAEAGVSESALWPTLDATGDASRSRSTPSVEGEKSPIRNAAKGGLSAGWEIDLFGKVRRSVEAASARLDARTADARSMRLSLTTDVAGTWYELRACTVNLDQFEADARSRERTRDLTRLKAGAGFAAPADVALSDASTAEARSQTEDKRGECRRLRNALAALTGLSLAEIEKREGNEVRPDIALLPQPPSVALGVPAAVLDNHPDIRAAERAVAAASAEIGVAEAARYPALSLSGSFSRETIRSQGNSIFFSPWLFGPAISLPLFDGGKRASQVEAAVARYDQAAAVLRQKVRSAVEDVENALARSETAAARETYVLQALEGYGQSFAATEARYQRGTVSLLDLENTRRSLLEAQKAHVALKLERLKAWTSLVKATGGSPTDSAPLAPPRLSSGSSQP